MEAHHGQFNLPGEIRFVRRLPGPAERVWDYLTDPEKRGKWLASGRMDLRPGGQVELRFNHAELTPHKEEVPEQYREMSTGGHLMRGHIIRCEPPRFLSYTWTETEVAHSEVSFELVPRGEEVELILCHRKLGDDPAMLAGIAGGWHTHLRILGERLEGRPPRPFWDAFMGLEAEYSQRLRLGPG